LVFVFYVAASEMTYIVSSGALNSTHSLRLCAGFFKICVVVVTLVRGIRLSSNVQGGPKSKSLQSIIIIQSY